MNHARGRPEEDLLVTSRHHPAVDRRKRVVTQLNTATSSAGVQTAVEELDNRVVHGLMKLLSVEPMTRFQITDSRETTCWEPPVAPPNR